MTNLIAADDDGREAILRYAIEDIEAVHYAKSQQGAA